MSTKTSHISWFSKSIFIFLFSILISIGTFSIANATTGTISATTSPVCKINPNATECGFLLSWNSDSFQGVEIWADNGISSGRFTCTGNYINSGIAYTGTVPTTFSLYTYNDCGANPNVVPDASHFLASTTVYAELSTDGTAPVITLNGANPDTQLLTQSGVYTDLGATAFDAIDGTTTVTVLDYSDTSTLGTSTITYTTHDSSGNYATATRTINTVSTIGTISASPNPCVITGTSTTCNTTITWTSEGLNTGTEVWSDTGRLYCGGNPSLSAPTVAGTNPMTFTLYTYNDCGANPNVPPDASHFLASTSVVGITDTIPPVITILGPNPATTSLGSIYTDLGATAFDNGDGTTTVVATGTVNTAATGTYSILYISIDSSGNVATGTRTVNVVIDNQAPIITAPVTQTFEATGTTTTPTLIPATSTDNVNSNPIITYLPLSFNLGTTTVIWTATDSSGNFATTSSLVVIHDTTAPVITITGSSSVAVLAETPYTELGATASDTVNGSVAVSVIFNNVDIFNSGTYQVVYSATDNSLNQSFATRTVDVYRVHHRRTGGSGTGAGTTTSSGGTSGSGNASSTTEGSSTDPIISDNEAASSTIQSSSTDEVISTDALLALLKNNSDANSKKGLNALALSNNQAAGITIMNTTQSSSTDETVLATASSTENTNDENRNIQNGLFATVYESLSHLSINFILLVILVILIVGIGYISLRKRNQI